MKPQANPHVRGEAGDLGAHPFEIARIAGSRQRAATCGIRSGKFCRIARKVQVTMRVDKQNPLRHSNRPPFSKPISEQIT